MNILVAPDSFKGTLEAERVCRIIRYAAKRAFPDCKIVELPLADGGEGTASLMAKALRGKLENVLVEGPFGKKVKATVAFIDKGKTAIIESAQAIGLPLAGKRSNPERTSSYGVGQMISHAVSRGAERVLIALGGSCTNDLGTGMLSAMGVCFVDASGNRFTPVGGNLGRIERIDFNQEFLKYRDVKFVLMCDVKNPLLGENGAAVVFAPQKGADREGVARLEKGAEKLVSVVQHATGKDMSKMPGSGAAGGIGYGALTFLNAEITSGIKAVLDMYSFERYVEDADIIITGEGRLDSQSFMGKAVGGVLERRGEKPCVIVCGSADEVSLPKGVTVFSASSGVGVEYAIENAAECLQNAIDRYFESIK